ncbi:hypothetical protein M1M92_03855 [Peptococcaceae bacterium]|nr:hypothetical protein [Peptococcaceae bacterium]
MLWYEKSNCGLRKVRKVKEMKRLICYQMQEEDVEVMQQEFQDFKHGLPELKKRLKDLRASL